MSNSGAVYQMANKFSNVAYDQIPHIVINHPDTNPEHKEIIRALFKVLKDVSIPIVYTNEALAKECRISLRTIERRMTELVKMGFINCTGRGYNRRISLGFLFVNSAKLAVKSIPTAKSAFTTTKNDSYNRQCGGDYKPYTNPYSKVDAYATSTLTQFNMEYHDYRKTIENDRRLGLESGNVKIMTQEEFEKFSNI